MQIVMFDRQSIFIHGMKISLQQRIPGVSIQGASQADELWQKLESYPEALVMLDGDQDGEFCYWLLQKTVVMVEGVATNINPSINMWDAASPYIRNWIRDELGPEAMVADGLRKQVDTLRLIPDIIRRLDEQLPRKGAAPKAPPLPDVPLMWRRGDEPRSGHSAWRTGITALLGVAVGAGLMHIIGMHLLG